MKQASLYYQVVLVLCCTLFITSCKNYYNDAIYWMDSLEPQTNIDTVIKNQPKYIQIDWDDPEKIRNEDRYYIENIKGSRDPLGMSHILVFINDKFVRRESHK